MAEFPALKLHILKFGGSSVATPDRIRNSVSIVRGRLQQVKVAVVVSALGGVTDEILAILDLACGSDPRFEARLQHLRKRHHDSAAALTDGTGVEELRLALDELFEELGALLHRVREASHISAAQRDHALSFGERLSCRIFAAALRAGGIPAKSYESHHFVRTNNRFGDADVDNTITNELVRKLLGPVNGTVPVITGFIGATAENEITTLGRSGSDYTAGLMGEALEADVVEIWTDVNGVLTADPNIADTAVTIPRLHYAEIAEMAHFGTKVLHPRTVLPLEELNIPILIKNSFEPENEGTLITREFSRTDGMLKSVSLKKDIVLFGLKSKGLDRITGLLPRALNALEEAGIPVLFNSAASADFGITFAVPDRAGDPARHALYRAFEPEYRKGLIDDPIVLDQVSLVTVIGERLIHDLGLSGAVLSVLGENRIAPLAVAKGVSNRHLSLVLKNEEARTAVILLNDHFCVHAQRVRVFLAGTGTIGAEILNQLDRLKTTEYDLSVVGLCDSRRMVWNPAGMAPGQALALLETGDVTDWTAIVDKLESEYAYRTVFVDASGSLEAAKHYARLLKAGIHIATPSKRANTLDQAYFDLLMSYTVGQPTHYLYEATVGAGLPVLQTLKDLIRGGDVVREVNGVVSGTMTYLFDRLQQGAAFGETVRQARQLGYAEPDPRDDLSGEDVARKFIILARTAGFRVERAEVEVEDLTPPELRQVSTEEFLARIDEADGYWAGRVRQAAETGQVLRYVGTLAGGKIRIGVKAVPAGSPLGGLKGTDNLIAIATDRYTVSPLTIQGPGAGKEVTAAGVIADLQKIAIRIVR